MALGSWSDVSLPWEFWKAVVPLAGRQERKLNLEALVWNHDFGENSSRTSPDGTYSYLQLTWDSWICIAVAPSTFELSFRVLCLF